MPRRSGFPSNGRQCRSSNPVRAVAQSIPLNACRTDTDTDAPAQELTQCGAPVRSVRQGRNHLNDGQPITAVLQNDGRKVRLNGNDVSVGTDETAYWSGNRRGPFSRMASAYRPRHSRRPRLSSTCQYTVEPSSRSSLATMFAPNSFLIPRLHVWRRASAL